MKIKPGTAKKPAMIELNEEDEEKIRAIPISRFLVMEPLSCPHCGEALNIGAKKKERT